MRAEAILLMGLILAGCTSTPKPADPPRLRAALEAESDGARRYERGDFAVAARRFEEAARLHAAIDDTAGSSRNRLHLARTQLALGQAEAALTGLAAEHSNEGGPSLDALLLRAQAQLSLKRDADAGASLALAAARCGAGCAQSASLNLLQARTALAGQRLPEALARAEAALKLLRDRDEPAETGNAWRLIAAARLAGDDAGGALAAAQAALDIDHRLAVPEKIARDWLLIGAARAKVSAGDAAAAYRRALDIARAAGLDEITTAATQALNATGMQKNLR